MNHSEGTVSIDNDTKFTIKGVDNSTNIQMHIEKPANWLRNNNLYSLVHIDKNNKDKDNKDNNS